MRTSFFVVAALLAASTLAQVHEHNAGQLHIEYPWALTLLPTLSDGAVYFMVQNHDKENDTLLGADMPRTASVEVHEHVHKNGMMDMQKVDSVDTTPGKGLCFVPGGYHLMLVGLRQPLVVDERPLLMLHFRKAGDVPVEIVVESEMPAEQNGHEQRGH